MNGQNYYNRQDAAATASEYKKGNPVSTTEIKEGLGDSSGSLRTITRGSEDDRTPLNVTRSVSARDVPDVPPIPPDTRFASSGVSVPSSPARMTNRSGSLEPTIPSFALSDTSSRPSYSDQGSYNHSGPAAGGSYPRGGYHPRGGFAPRGAHAYRGGGRGGFPGGPPPNSHLGNTTTVQGGPAVAQGRRAPRNFSLPRAGMPPSGSVDSYDDPTLPPLSMPEPDHTPAPLLPGVSRNNTDSPRGEGTIGQAIEMTPQRRYMGPRAVEQPPRSESPSSMYSRTT